MFLSPLYEILLAHHDNDLHWWWVGGSIDSLCSSMMVTLTGHVDWSSPKRKKTCVVVNVHVDHLPFKSIMIYNQQWNYQDVYMIIYLITIHHGILYQWISIRCIHNPSLSTINHGFSWFATENTSHDPILPSSHPAFRSTRPSAAWVCSRPPASSAWPIWRKHHGIKVVKCAVQSIKVYRNGSKCSDYTWLLGPYQTVYQTVYQTDM